jgi:hypothetical protein
MPRLSNNDRNQANAVAGYDDLVGWLLLLVVLAEDDRTHCSWFETSVWGVQQYFNGNWIVKQRLAWAKPICNGQSKDGRKLFSDESRFCISNADGRIRVWKTSVWGVQQYFNGNWIVKQLLWLICLLSTYPKLGCDHYYSDVAFLKLFAKISPKK